MSQRWVEQLSLRGEVGVGLSRCLVGLQYSGDELAAAMRLATGDSESATVLTRRGMGLSAHGRSLSGA